jgi:hypothetical protein
VALCSLWGAVDCFDYGHHSKHEIASTLVIKAPRSSNESRNPALTCEPRKPRKRPLWSAPTFKFEALDHLSGKRLEAPRHWSKSKQRYQFLVVCEFGARQCSVLAYIWCGWTAYKMVRPMVVRTYAAGLVVVIGVVFVLASNEACARSGGFGARSFSVASGFRSPGLRPNFRPALQPGFRSGLRPGFRPALRSAFFNRHRSGFGVPLTWPGGSYYDPSDYGAPYEPLYFDPSGGEGEIPAEVNPVAIHRWGCRSQTVTVPSEDGGESSVNIVRCY